MCSLLFEKGERNNGNFTNVKLVFHDMSSKQITIASKMNLFSLAYLIFVITTVYCFEGVEEVVLHDSLADQDSILDIQQNSLISEPLHTITREKTVYVTLNPTTIYVTITEAPESTSNLTEYTELLTSLNISRVPTEKSSFLKSIESTKANQNSIVIVTKTEVELISSTKVVKPSSDLTKSNSEVMNSLTAPYFFNTTITSESISVHETKSIGELRLVLGDQSKFEGSHEERTRRIVSPTSSSSETLQFSVTDTAVVKAPFPTSVIEEFQRVESSSSVTNEITWGFNPFDDYEIGSETVTSSLVSSTFTSQPIRFNGTYNTAVANNQTGLDHLLENFRPYTDLPTADYTLANTGSQICKGFIGFLIVFVGIVL